MLPRRSAEALPSAGSSPRRAPLLGGLLSSAFGVLVATMGCLPIEVPPVYGALTNVVPRVTLSISYIIKMDISDMDI
jgi:hypothetical protein